MVVVERKRAGKSFGLFSIGKGEADGDGFSILERYAALLVDEGDELHNQPDKKHGGNYPDAEAMEKFAKSITRFVSVHTLRGT